MSEKLTILQLLMPWYHKLSVVINTHHIGPTNTLWQHLLLWRFMAIMKSQVYALFQEFTAASLSHEYWAIIESIGGWDHVCGRHAVWVCCAIPLTQTMAASSRHSASTHNLHGTPSQPDEVTDPYTGMAILRFPCKYPYFKYKILVVSICFISCPIMLKFYTEQNNITTMFCAKFQEDWTTWITVID